MPRPVHPQRRFASLAIIALSVVQILLTQPAFASATLTWPNLLALGPCQASLQACIDEAAPGDTVQIGIDDLFVTDRYTTVNENLAINKSLTLRGAPGIDAVFTAGHGITITPPFVSLVSYSVAVENITLDRGSIVVNDATFSSTFRVENVRFNDVPSDQVAIDMLSTFGSSSNFQVLRNVIRTKPHGATSTVGIRVNPQALNASITVSGNRVDAMRGGLQQAIVIVSAATGPITVSNNTIEGRRFLAGIYLGQPVSTGAANAWVINNSISGQHSDAGSGYSAITLELHNADAQVINNTAVYGSRGISFNPVSPSVSGVLANNIVAFNSITGLMFSAGYAGLSNRNNLVFGNTANFGFVPGAGTLVTDPLLISRGYPRPTDLSPAINGGSDSALAAIGFDPFDVDGQPRVLLGTVDIGAYEAGYGITAVHETNADNIAGNFTSLSSLGDRALVPSAELVVTALHSAGESTALAQNLGVWQPVGAGNLPLAIFHENPSPVMHSGRRIAVTVPGFGLSGFLHLSKVGNIFSQYTQLSDSALNGHPAAIAVATHNYLVTGPYHDYAIGLEYSGTSWYLRNEDNVVDMQPGRSFNIVIAPALSDNAFRVVASGGTGEIPVAHPLLDDNACAAPIVGRVANPDASSPPLNTTAFSLDYRAGSDGAPGRWFVLAEGDGAPVSFPNGAAFNVILDGEQANRCRADDTIFADSFD